MSQRSSCVLYTTDDNNYSNYNMKLSFSFLAMALGSAVAAAKRTVLIQESPLAGFPFHDGEYIWSSLKVGKTLKLVREPDNDHDPDAVAIYYGDSQLGYVPRVDNTAIAQMLDRGEKLEASITKLNATDDPWDRVWFSVVLT